MNIYSHMPGVHNVGSYQVSGRPWLTGSADIDANVQHKIGFPFVAKSVRVINKSEVDLRVHFNDSQNVVTPGEVTGSSTAKGSGHHYVTLTGALGQQAERAITMNVRCKEVYITSTAANGAYEVFAELTGIPAGSLTPMSGSGLTD